MRQWFVGQTKDWQRAAKDLREQGYGVFMPKIYLRVQEGRKNHARAALRFPGYIFIACEAHETGPISSTRGMDDSGGSALLGGARPVPVHPAIIERLRRIEDDELGLALASKRPQPRNDLTPGDVVVIAGDRGHVAFGQQGHYLGSDRGVASVLAGMAIWKVAEGDLKRAEPERKAAA